MILRGSGPDRSFTLIELLVVVVIVTVLSVGVVIDLAGSARALRSRDSVRRVTDMLGFCRSQAVFESSTFRFVADLEEAICSVQFEKEPVKEPGVFEPYKASGYQFLRLPEGVLFLEFEVSGGREQEDERRPVLEFYADGTSEEAVLVVGRPEEEAFTIRVDRLTGGVHVEEGWPKESIEEAGG